MRKKFITVSDIGETASTRLRLRKQTNLVQNPLAKSVKYLE